MIAQSSVGAAIKRERKRLGWTGADVQKRAGVDPTSLSMFERGEREPRLLVLRRLASAFGVPLAALVDDTGSMVARKRVCNKPTHRVPNKRAAAKSGAIPHGIATRRRATK